MIGGDGVTMATVAMIVKTVVVMALVTTVMVVL